VGGSSGCNKEGQSLIIVGGHGWIPDCEQVAQRAVESAGSGLQEPMGAFPRPLHLLLLGEAPADDEVEGGFGAYTIRWRPRPKPPGAFRAEI
jgi:hypothetical protein